MEVNKIYNMDCMTGLKEMANDSVDVVITSPPYNANVRLCNGKYTKINDWKDNRRKYNDFDDALMPLEYFEWQKGVIKELLRVCKYDIFYNIQMLSSNKLALFKILGEFSDYVKEIFIWDKKHGEPAIQHNVVNSVFEFIIVFSKNQPIKRAFINSTFERGTFPNMIRIGKNYKNKNCKVHTAVFPIDLPRLLIKNFSKEGQTILDPFMGTGTVAEVCKQLNRKFIGFEIDGDYIKISDRKLQQQNLNTLFQNKENEVSKK
jgi:site-specific DNA-methyltransferase (adenine-specific)/modification methylase